MEPVEIEFFMRNRMQEGFTEVTSSMDDVQQELLVTKQVVAELERQLLELQNLKVTPDIDQSANIAMIEALKAKIEELKTEIESAKTGMDGLGEEAQQTRVIPPDLPKAKGQFNGLNMSIQQIAREMPALAMGPQMFFLAISNNLPIFADELSRARREYDALVKSGEKGVPVWKQIISSLFSWQTAMTTGIMLLVMYGDEIINAISDMTGWGAAQREMREEIEKSIEVEKEAIGVAAKTRFELIQTMNSIRTFNGTKEEERQKIDQLNSKYGESFGYYQTLAGWYDTLTLKAQEYTEMMFLQAKQQSLLSKSIEAEQQIESIRKKGKEEYRSFFGDGGKANMFLGGDNLDQYGSDPAEVAWKKDMAKHEQERDRYLADMEFYRNREIEIAKDDSLNKVIVGSVADLENAIAARRKALSKITNKADYDTALKDIKTYEKKLEAITGSRKPKKEKDDSSDLTRMADQEVAARMKIEEQTLSLRQDGYNKERAQAAFAFKEEKVRIEREEKERLDLYEKLKKTSKKVDPAQKQVIQDQAALQKIKAAQLYDKELEKIDKKELKARQDSLKKLIEPYRDFTRQRLDMEKKFQDDVAKLQAQTSGARLKKMGDEMVAAFGNGNVDLLARPQIDAAKLVAAGWKDAGEGIATVFSSQFGVRDAAGKETEILVTPILPDGTVLSEAELQGYVDNVLSGAEDLLAADTKGIVISVGVNADGSAGEMLHEFQEEYYNLKNDTAGNADVDGQIAAAVIQAEQVNSDNLAELDRVYAEKDVYFQALMAQLSNMSLEQLYKALEQAEKALKDSEATGGKGSKETAVARAKVAALKDEIKYVKAENETKTPDDAKKWKKNSTAIKRCKDEIDGMIDSMDGLDEGTKAALQTASNVAGGAIAMIDGIKTLSVSAGESISAVEKASVILAIVGAAIQIMTAIFSMGAQAEKRHQEALAEVSANKLAMQREYNLLLLQQNLLMKEAENIFGEQSIAKAARAVEVYREAIRQYNEELQGDAPKLKLNPFNIKGSLDEFNKQKAAYEQGIGALNNVTIKTGHKKTGLFGWGKGKDIYSGVLDVYPDLIDGENRLNMERAKTIISTQTMSDENKNLLQNLIDLQEQADEAQEALRDYLTDTFGSLGDGMMDSIVEAIQTGNDAWESFGDKGAEVLENLGRQIAYSLFFAGKFDKLQKQLEAAYGSGKSEKEIAQDAMNIMGDFYAGIGQDMDQAQDFMENWKAEAAKRGFDLWKTEDGSQQSGKSGSFQTMDQETGTELKGLFTSVQQHEASIDENVQYVSDEMHQCTDYLREIAESTSGCNDKLKAIAQDIETIRRDGLKTQ